MLKSPKKCAFCHGRLGLLVSRHYGLRFCSRQHRAEFLKQESSRLDRLKRWYAFLSSPRQTT